MEAHEATLKWVGQALSAFAAVSEETSFVKMYTVWLTSLYFFWLGRNSVDQSVAVIHFGAALDVGVGDGKGAGEISKFLSVVLGASLDDVIVPSLQLTLGQVVEKIYGEGRSQSVHGGMPIISADQAMNRNLGEQVARLALLETVHLLIPYMGSNSVDDWGAFRKSKIRAAGTQ